MGPELEIKARLDGIMASCIKENGSLSVHSEDKYLMCESNCEDHALEMDNCNTEPRLADRDTDVEVNVTEFTTSDGNGLLEAEGHYATESLSSSSFDDTDSGSEDTSNTCGAEVGSNFRGYNSSSLAVDGLNDIFRMRKKRLTSHWRTYIQPLMWRCKWVELQVKKLGSQALKYDRELANRSQEKHFLVENLPVEGFGMKSIPYTSDGSTDKVLRRRKRRRVEDMMDVTSYMSHHNLFSYFENRIRAGSVHADDISSNQEKVSGSDELEINDERLWLKSGGGENSLEELLRKIGLLESQVCKLKTRLDKVRDENAGRFSSADNLGLVVLSNLTSSARSPASPNNGDRLPVGLSNIASQLLSHYNMGNVVMPEGAITNHGEMPYVTGVTKGMDQSHLGGPYIKAEDEILIYDNERSKGERNNFDEVCVQYVEKPLVAKEEPESTFTTLAGPDLQTNNHSAPKVRSIAKLTAPKSRKKRGRRKSGFGRGRRRSSS
ncbi:hypothetical protein ACH5RR_023773 [Cinchona calisaya]|uniref:Uncharacterized protein n=1 Tax=Cinchona calisaya TaxID=153742 RepID=A0ABD2ZBM9_9GENT